MKNVILCSFAFFATIASTYAAHPCTEELRTNFVGDFRETRNLQQAAISFSLDLEDILRDENNNNAGITLATLRIMEPFSPPKLVQVKIKITNLSRCFYDSFVTECNLPVFENDKIFSDWQTLSRKSGEFFQAVRHLGVENLLQQLPQLLQNPDYAEHLKNSNDEDSQIQFLIFRAIPESGLIKEFGKILVKANVFCPAAKILADESAEIRTVAVTDILIPMTTLKVFYYPIFLA
jgi:hypothetical protein